MADYWPGYTPDVIYGMDADLWPSLAVSCDELVEKRKRDIAEARARARG